MPFSESFEFARYCERKAADEYLDSLRVQAWQAYLQGSAKRGQSFEDYLLMLGLRRRDTGDAEYDKKRALKIADAIVKCQKKAKRNV